MRDSVAVTAIDSRNTWPCRYDTNLYFTGFSPDDEQSPVPCKVSFPSVLGILLTHLIHFTNFFAFGDIYFHQDLAVVSNQRLQYFDISFTGIYLISFLALVFTEYGSSKEFITAALDINFIDPIL